MAPDSIVVIGGKARRLGGIDKAMLPLGPAGATLLQSVINACPAKVVAVGAPRNVTGDVVWIDDIVADGGPAVGLWSALPHVATDYVFITAADQLIDEASVQQVCYAALGHEGAWAIREDGTGQPLFACVRTDVLRELLVETQGVNQSPLRLLSTREMVGISVKQGEIIDVDTWADVAEVAKREGVNVTQLWLDQIAQALGMDAAEVPVDELLDLTRDVAHGVERKAAPLTTFMLGLAAGQSGRDLNELIAATQIALGEWVPNDK